VTGSVDRRPRESAQGRCPPHSLPGGCEEDSGFARTRAAARGGAARFLVGFLVLWAVLAGASAADPTVRWGPAVLAAVVVASLGVSRFLDGLPWRAAVRALGLGRPEPRALAVSAVVSALVLLVWPATAWLSGASIPLRPDWPLALVGVLALHGLAEELVWRGYVFRRLARGRSFRSAVVRSMPLIALTHVPILLTAGPAVGIGAMAVAAVTPVPLSRLYAMGGGTVWAPALLHAAIDSFKLVVLPAAALAVYPLLIIGCSLAVPLLVLLVHTPSRKDPLR
jgi:membrane protease YdiL (CAAX protease family)